MSDRAGPSLLWAPTAWIEGRWQAHVVLRVDALGCWSEIRSGVALPPQGATVLAGPVLPGLINAHSHAFQRSFAGLAERLGDGPEGEPDDFWSWRHRMYSVALRIGPDQLRAVAAQLDVELLCGGYTQVCEFHYLQHAQDGRAYGDPATLAWALADAAGDTGIGLTLLPVLYERAGFGAAGLRDDQCRFASTPDSVLALQRSIASSRRPHVNAGVAIHSLRAASTASIETFLRRLDGDDMPIHIHVSEQTREVDDCLAAHGARPIEHLVRTFDIDARWQLVHATHAAPAEIDTVAASGAGVVLCPITEANLGDGFADLPGWLQAGVPLSVGSDSQMSRRWTDELRWLEYGQRLLHRRRNVAAVAGQPATAVRLFERLLASQGRSAGLSRWGLVDGARADALVVDTAAPGLAGVPPSHWLDALIFATEGPVMRDVYVAGRHLVQQGRHVDQDAIGRRFEYAMAQLWHDAE